MVNEEYDTVEVFDEGDDDFEDDEELDEFENDECILDFFIHVDRDYTEGVCPGFMSGDSRYFFFLVNYYNHVDLIKREQAGIGAYFF